MPQAQSKADQTGIRHRLPVDIRTLHEDQPQPPRWQDLATSGRYEVIELLANQALEYTA
ncbi:hypothetical protein GCM10027428_30670 [Haliea atlantica]